MNRQPNDHRLLAWAGASEAADQAANFDSAFHAAADLDALRSAARAKPAAVGQQVLLDALRALGERLAAELDSRAARTRIGHAPLAVSELPSARNAPVGPPALAVSNQTRSTAAHSPAGTVWTEVHLLIVGGAAGMLSGLLEPDRTTTDCDVMLYHPAEAGELVEHFAHELAGEFGLSEHWLNRGGAPWADAMPAGWEGRRVAVLSHGPLRVHAVGRLDLIALKLVAGRAQDIEDLEAMAVTPDELAALRTHFEEWSDDSWPAGVIAGARELLEILADALQPPDVESGVEPGTHS